MKNNVQKFAWLMVLATSSGVMEVSKAAPVEGPAKSQGPKTLDWSQTKKNVSTFVENARLGLHDRGNQLAEATGYNSQAHNIRKLNETNKFKVEDAPENQALGEGIVLENATQSIEPINTVEAKQSSPDKSGWNFRTAAEDTGRGINFAVRNPITTARSAASGIYQGGKAGAQYVGSGLRNTGYNLGLPNVSGRPMELSSLPQARQDAIQKQFATEGIDIESQSKVSSSMPKLIPVIKYKNGVIKYSSNASGATTLQDSLGNKLLTKSDGTQVYIPRKTLANSIGRGANYVGGKISSGATRAYNGMPTMSSFRKPSTESDVEKIQNKTEEEGTVENQSSTHPLLSNPADVVAVAQQTGTGAGAGAGASASASASASPFKNPLETESFEE